MTAQIEDQLRHRNTRYTVAATSGPLFNPSMLGLTPTPLSSACWRGFCASFAIIESRLVLENLDVHLLEEGDHRQQGPQVKHVAPTDPQENAGGFNNHYAGINCDLAYSGGVLVGADLVRGYFVRGWQPAWGYRLALELVFENGILVEERDTSKCMAEIRKSGWELESALDDEVQAFIARSFRCTYTWSH